MKTLGNTKKQQQFKKFIGKDAAFLKKIVGGEEQEKLVPEKVKI